MRRSCWRMPASRSAAPRSVLSCCMCFSAYAQAAAGMLPPPQGLVSDEGCTSGKCRAMGVSAWMCLLGPCCPAASNGSAAINLQRPADVLQRTTTSRRRGSRRTTSSASFASRTRASAMYSRACCNSNLSCSRLLLCLLMLKLQQQLVGWCSTSGDRACQASQGRCPNALQCKPQRCHLADGLEVGGEGAPQEL